MNSEPSFFSDLISFFWGQKHSLLQNNIAPEVDMGSILHRLKRIEILSNRLADETLSGQYRSAFRGQGIEFDEVREYTEGDDVRSIDWNVTARSGKPYVKRYAEERERSIIFMLDVSASNIFGSQISRRETAAEIAAALMFSALKNNDKIGLITFANNVSSFYPPRKGRNYVLRLVREIFITPSLHEPTNLNVALDFVNKTIKRRAVVFILSDFFVPQLSESLTLSAQRHDIVALSICEPLEKRIPNLGFISLRDPETGETIELDSGSQKVRHNISTMLLKKRENIAEKLKSAHVDYIEIENGTDYVQPLRTFFRRRLKR